MSKENENLSYIKLTKEDLERVSGGIEEYICADCGFRCSTKAEMDDHKIQYHSGGMKKEELVNP